MSWCADHHAGGDGDAAPAVGVGHDVAVADRQEGDGDQPHRVQQVGVLLVMVPGHHGDHDEDDHADHDEDGHGDVDDCEQHNRYQPHRGG